MTFDLENLLAILENLNVHKSTKLQVEIDDVTVPLTAIEFKFGGIYLKGDTPKLPKGVNAKGEVVF